MEVLLFEPTEFERLYNCSAYDLETIPLEKRQHKLLGIGFFTLTTIYQLLYVPCQISIWKHTKNSHCYKIMFYIGIIDMLTLIVNGWMTGYLGFIGAVYCSSPRMIYIAGAFGLGLWCAESSAEVVLALNRCIELWSNDMANDMFGNYKLWLWLGVPSLYGLYYIIFTKPVIFTGIYFSWFFNPHVGYIEDPQSNQYENIGHTIHNNVLLTILAISYATFCVILVIKTIGRRQAYGGNERQQTSFSQKMIFLQVFMISIINAIAASVYVYMQYFHISEALIVLGQFCWMNAHGIPPIIYLTMNKSIQRDVRAMFYRAMGKTASSIHPISGSHAPRHTRSRITAALANSSGNLHISREPGNIYSIEGGNNMVKEME